MLINDTNLNLIAKGFKTIVNEHFDATPSHKDTLAMTTTSHGMEEEYGWLGQFPGLREWIGDRHIKQLASHGFKIRNRKFESTVVVTREDIADDRVGVYTPMFKEMGRVSKQHPETMLFELLASGFDGDAVCYDGQSFFDAEHPIKVADMATELVSNVQAGSGAPWFLLDLSKAIKPMVWQDREKYEFQSLTDNTNGERVFMRDEYLYGIRARVNCGFGLWQLAFGSKATLDATNYEAAREAMMKFGGDRGQKLGIMPTHLVVGPSNEKKARALVNSDQNDGTSNIWKGTAEIILTPFLA